MTDDLSWRQAQLKAAKMAEMAMIKERDDMERKLERLVEVRN